MYFSYLNPHAKALKDSGKGILYLNNKFIYGIVSDAKQIDLTKLKEVLADGKDVKVNIVTKNVVAVKKEKVTGILQFNVIMPINVEKVTAFLDSCEFKALGI